MPVNITIPLSITKKKKANIYPSELLTNILQCLSKMWRMELDRIVA